MSKNSKPDAIEQITNAQTDNFAEIDNPFARLSDKTAIEAASRIISIAAHNLAPRLSSLEAEELFLISQKLTILGKKLPHQDDQWPETRNLHS
jgi:hypothetical protein